MLYKKLLFLLVVSYALFGGEVKYDYVFKAPLIKDGAISMEGCHPFFSPFVPLIPVKSARLLLPDGEQPVSYEIAYGDPVVLPGSYEIRPYRPENRIGTKLPDGFFTFKDKVYYQNSFFPQSTRSESFETQHKGGHPIFMTQLYPVQYNPVTGQVRYYNIITVTVHTESVRADERMYKATSDVIDALSYLVDNPSAVRADLRSSPVSANDYEYLIITTTALKDAFTDFIAFNTRRGLRTKVVTLETAIATGTGSDNQEKIRSFVKQEYKNCNIKYLLLGGDPDQYTANMIPCRKLYSEDWDYNYTGLEKDHYKDNIPSDMYYGCLDDAPHDWKPTSGSNWGVYGTEDKTYEVYVGRFSCDNATEIGNMINKTIKFSEQPVADQVTTAILAGEFLWGPPDHPATCYGDDEMEQIIGTCNTSYGPTTGFPSSGWTLSKLYAKQATWGFTEFVSRAKSAKPTIINHEGHSNKTYLFGGSSWTTGNFPQNGSTAGNFFLVMSGGCYPGAMDNADVGSTNATDCVAEQLTAKLATGAVAAIFNARYGFGSDGANGCIGTDGSEQKIRRYFHHGIFGMGYHTLGRIDAYSKEVIADGWTNSTITGTAGYVSYWGQLKWETYEKNLLGDPALSFWTAKPDSLKPVLPTITSTKFTVTVPKYSTVALADPSNNTIITSITGDQSGSVSIENAALTAFIQANPQGTIKVIIKAHNKYPYSGTATINATGILNGIGQSMALTSVKLLTSGVRYSLATSAGVSLELYNAKGALVWKNAREMKTAGEHFISFDNAGLSNTMYYFKLVAGAQKYNGKFIFVK